MSSDLNAPKRVPLPRRPRDAATPRRGALARPASSHLPIPLTSLIGREAEVAAVGAMLRDDGVRLVTLTGPGGVGKTRLALRIAEETTAFPDGVVFVPLAPISDPDLVLQAITRQLGLQVRATQSVAEILASYLNDRRLLLVLDNFEQVTGAAPCVAALLESCPRLTVLATSRTRLRVSGEHRFPVSPLALPGDETAIRQVSGLAGGGKSASGESSARQPLIPRHPDTPTPIAQIERSPAVKLFVERAQAVEPQFVLDADNAPTVAAVCRRLDGLPLAIELAAVHMRFLNAAELLTRLEPALPLLTEGPADTPDRLRTMRNAIAWSYNLLGPAEQTLLRRLSVFVGGCRLAAAEAVITDGSKRAPSPRTTLRRAAEPTDIPGFLETLAALVDASLVRRHDAGAETRLTMLQTIREFAWEQLAASGELAAVAARHAGWCIQLAEGIRQSGALSRREGLAELEIEHPNLRAALGWLLAQGEVTEALHLAGEIAEFWHRHAHLAEGRAWLEQALAADDGPPTAARANALVGLNMLLWWRGEGFSRLDELLGEAEAVARAAGDAGALAYARLHQGYVALYRGDLEVAEARGSEGLATVAAIPQGFSLHAVHWLLAEVALARGEDERAREHFTRLLGLARAGGDEISLVNALAGLATLAERRGEPGAALRGCADAAAVCQSSGELLHAALRLEQAAATAAAMGRIAAAVRLFATADALCEVAGVESRRLDARNRDRHERVLLTTRAALNEDSFAALWAAGAALSLEEAIAEVRALAGQLSATTPADREAWPVALTGREREVLRLLADGLGDKAIAVALGISRRTASQHVAAILTKSGAESRTAAVSRALRQGLLGISHPESS